MESYERIGITGSRSFHDLDLFESVLSKYQVEELVSGGAEGADSLAERYARENHLKMTTFLPEWKKYGRAAGPIRNKKIVDNSDFVIAFWDGKSKGTKSCIDYARKVGKGLKIVEVCSL